MRRVLGLLVVVALMVPALGAVGDETADYADDFGSGNYAGNDGSLDFSGPWVEIGESNGAGSGKVRVDDDNCSNNRCLRIEGALLPTGFGASRKADLSSFTSAELTFEMKTELPLLSSGTLRVHVRGNGSDWEILDSYTIASGNEYEEEFDVSAYAGSDFELRFQLSTTLLGLLGGPRAFIDRVQIEGPLEATTTSTSTTTSTTSTTAPTTTTTTRPIVTTTTSGSPTTTSGSATTSTTSGGATTSTTAPNAGTEPGGGSGPGAVGTTTTTSTPGTTPGGPTGGGGPTAGGPTDGEATGVPGEGPSPDPELRVPAVGLIAGYTPGLMGDMETGEVEVLGVSLDADFSLAVEAFEAARLWIAALSLLIAAAVVSGMDRRRNVPTR